MKTSKSTERLHSFYFAVTAKINVPEMKVSIMQENFPGVTSMECTSRIFDTYDECISSCKKFMDEVMKKANNPNPIFKMGSEVNPIHSGQTTLSKDWSPGEISRLWVYDKSMEEVGQIHAIGQARIFAQVGTTSFGLTQN